MRAKATDSKVEQYKGIMATNATASSLAKEARDSTVGTNRACSNKRDRKNKYSNGMPKLVGRICTLAEPIYYRGGS